MPADYYVLLGISRGADLKRIKSAYRKIAKQFHPDITRTRDSEHRFREIKEAYETLADENKRRTYDDELARREEPRGISPRSRIIHQPVFVFDAAQQCSTAVDEFFEGFLPGFFEPENRRLPQKDLYYEIILSPQEALEGGLFPITVPVFEVCPRCRETEYGEGFFCPTCRGYGRLRAQRTFSLSIPPRTRPETRARISLEDIGLKGIYLNILVSIYPDLEYENW